jgi:hypothetical protein
MEKAWRRRVCVGWVGTMVSDHSLNGGVEGRTAGESSEAKGRGSGH